MERKWFNDSKQLTRITQQAVDNSWRLYESYDENGNIRDRREEKNQYRSGLYIASRGEGLEKVKYLKGKRHGTYTVTDGDGNVTSQGEYKYGKKVGKWIITDYYGTLKEHYNKDGKLTGVRERYNEKGELTLREHYKSGEKNGEYLEYKDGKLVVKGQYTKGRRQGEWRESQGYAPYRAVKGRYQNGVRVGKWRIYSPNGYLRGIEFYNNEGLMDGLLVTFSQEGALAQVVQYKNDRRHGKSWSYKSGKPFSIAVYEQGEMKEKRYKDDFKLSEFP